MHRAAQLVRSGHPERPASTLHIHSLPLPQKQQLRARHCRRRQKLKARALLPGVCFTESCQQAADRIFLLVIAAPLCGLAAAVLWQFWPGSPQQKQDGHFSDPETGTVFASPEGRQPERDRKGELAFKAISYTPWPVEEGASGERVRIDVGPVNQRRARTYVFERRLPRSQIVTATLPRPMGIVFEEDARRGLAKVAGFVPGSAAEQRNKVAKINRQMMASCAQEGDVLRACTATNFVYRNPLFNAQAPTRTIVLYGADGQTWPKVMNALRRGDREDGDVSLVLERPQSI